MVDHAAIRPTDLPEDPNLLGVEMESGGVAAAIETTQSRPDLVVVRCVSEILDRSTRDDGWLPYAADTAATFTVALIQKLQALELKKTPNGENAQALVIAAAEGEANGTETSPILTNKKGESNSQTLSGRNAASSSQQRKRRAPIKTLPAVANPGFPVADLVFEALLRLENSEPGRMQVAWYPDSMYRLLVRLDLAEQNANGTLTVTVQGRQISASKDRKALYRLMKGNFQGFGSLLGHLQRVGDAGALATDLELTLWQDFGWNGSSSESFYQTQRRVDWLVGCGLANVESKRIYITADGLEEVKEKPVQTSNLPLVHAEKPLLNDPSQSAGDAIKNRDNRAANVEIVHLRPSSASASVLYPSQANPTVHPNDGVPIGKPVESLRIDGGEELDDVPPESSSGFERTKLSSEEVEVDEPASAPTELSALQPASEREPAAASMADDGDPAKPLGAEKQEPTAPSPETTPANKNTFTLTIRDGQARLALGNVPTSADEIVWQAAHAVDWSHDLFVDTAGKRRSLAAALELLPRTWGRSDVVAFGVTLTRLLFGDAGPERAALTLLQVPPGEQRRMVLDLDESSFRVPWEYLFVNGYFLAEQRLSIVRHIAGRTRRAGVRLARPRRLLIAYANPKTAEVEPFDGDWHNKKISEVLDTFPGLEITRRSSCTRTELQTLLQTTDGQVFHFLGHGLPGGVREEASLLVHAAVGADPTCADQCGADELARWLRDRSRDLVVLGACHAGAAPKAGVMSGVGARIVDASGTPVVAMQMAVPQEFSTTYLANFYRELRAADYDVEVAVYMARRTEHERRHAFGIPVLLADARALDDVPELAAPPKSTWAHFDVRVTLTAATAGPAWAASDAVPTALRSDLVAALAREAASRPDAEVPPPPNTREGLRAALEALKQALSKDNAHAVAEAIAPSPPSLPRSGRITVHNDAELRDRVTPERYRDAVRAVEAKLSLPEGLVARIIVELVAGKHVLLTGPVGTGKTTLAQHIVQALGYVAHLETASADWTRFEVLGGFWPTPGSTELKFRPGVFVEAVVRNWHEAKDGDLVTWRRVESVDAAGTWLILDELNRADMDRALGGIFTALETRKLRVPVDDGALEIPIPADFRVIATINGADRHFLFRLSDALKRRFAFVHVPVTTAWTDEWNDLAPDSAELTGVDDLRRFVALVRVLHPLGTALVKAALGYLVAARRLDGETTDDRHLLQAIAGSILPNLEDMRRDALVALHAWTVPGDVDKLGEALRPALAVPLAAIKPMLDALAATPLQLVGGSGVSDDGCPPLERDAVADWIARRIGRPSSAPELPSLARALTDLVAHAQLA